MKIFKELIWHAYIESPKKAKGHRLGEDVEYYRILQNNLLPVTIFEKEADIMNS